jgi:Skp family chaperone for outer membrane proteins
MKILTIGAFAVATLAASSASAQQATVSNPGPVLPGVCAYSPEGILTESAAGRALQARMVQLYQEVQGELQPYVTSLESEAQQLQQNGASLSEADRNSRIQALQGRDRDLQQLQQTRSNELRYTQAVQSNIINTAAQPIVIAVYQERGCGVLLNDTALGYINPAMDISATVKQRLDAQLPTLSFNRMPVPAQAQ